MSPSTDVGPGRHQIGLRILKVLDFRGPLHFTALRVAVGGSAGLVGEAIAELRKEHLIRSRIRKGSVLEYSLARFGRATLSWTPDEEASMALELMSKENQLALQVLHQLLGEPKRFHDLRHLTKANEAKLKRNLHRLAEQGLVRQGMSLHGTHPSYYAATGLGVAVTIKTHEYRPLVEILGELLRAQNA